MWTASLCSLLSTGEKTKYANTHFDSWVNNIYASHLRSKRCLWRMTAVTAVRAKLKHLYKKRLSMDLRAAERRQTARGLVQNSSGFSRCVSVSVCPERGNMTAERVYWMNERLQCHSQQGQGSPSLFSHAPPSSDWMTLRKRPHDAFTASGNRKHSRQIKSIIKKQLCHFKSLRVVKNK